MPKYLPPSLRVIRLVGVAMPRSSIIQLDSWPFLTDLSLLSCTNMGSMLHEFRSPKLVSFTLRDAPESDEILLDVLACMLRRFDTFQTLSIDSEPGGVAEAEEFRAFAEALVHHSEHLKSLILNVGLGSVPMEWGVHEYVFGEIARCAKLEELAVGMESNDLVHITKVRFDPPLGDVVQNSNAPACSHPEHIHELETSEIVQCIVTILGSAESGHPASKPCPRDLPVCLS